MNMRSPVVAMLWEQWRLTRVEAAQRFGLGIVAVSAALVLFDATPTTALWFLIAVHSCFWFSISKLNGGRFMDGYKPGFPLHLLYSRPVPTVVFVVIAMAYDALSCAALYIASAALLGIAFGQPLPLFSVALWLVTFHLACTCIQWSTRNRVVQWAGSIGIGWPLFFQLYDNVSSSLQVEFSPIENAAMVLIWVVSFGLTIAGVARQRRGDAVAREPGKTESGVYPNWLINLFRFPCPTSSAMRAQAWFELRSSGLPVLAVGLGVATLIFLLFAISVSVAPVRTFAMGVAIFSAPIMLFLLASNAFGIRRRQGRLYASLFESTLPYGTAQFAVLKVLVRATCVLVALLAIGMSVWTSASLMGTWEMWAPAGDKNAVPGLLELRHEIGGAFAQQTGYVYAALGVVAAIIIAGVVVWHAAREALRARYGHGVLIVDWLPPFCGFALILVTLAGRFGIASPSQVAALFGAIGWIMTGAIVLATIYLLWSGFAERVLTIRYACGALAITAVFAAAWLTVLLAAGLPLSGMTATKAIWLLWLVPLLLMQSFLAPWSLNRVRHA